MANHGETLDQRAKQAAADAKSGAAEFAETARERVSEMADEARERAYQYGREYKDEAASETSKIADALRKAANDLHDGSPQERVFAKLADTVADTADGMRSMELDEMAYAVNDFARRNAGAFLGSAALLGFVAARFMKSSARSSGSTYGSPARYPDTDPHDYDTDDRIDRPAPTGTRNGAASTYGTVGTGTAPSHKPNIPGAPEPGGTTGPVTDSSTGTAKK